MDRKDIAERLARSWDWLYFAAQLPANPIPVPSTSASKLVYSGRCILTGGVFTNSGGGAGSVQLLDGQDNTGTLVGAAAVAAGATSPITIAGQGVLCELGVYLVVTTATIIGSAWIIPLWHDQKTPPGD